MTPDKTMQKLFVEGHSDGAVVNKLVLLRLGVDLSRPSSHQIVQVGQVDGGFDAALGGFAAALAAKRPARLGLLVDRDATDGKPDRWNAVHAALSNAGLNPPTQPPAEGVRVDAQWGQRIGVWLMPDNLRSGDLESFLEGLLPEPPPPTWGFALEATIQAKSLGATFRETHQPKARFHTWLAWHDPPGNPYGTAIEARVLSAAAPAVDPFIDWFRWLFGP